MYKQMGPWSPEEERLLHELWARRADGIEVVASFLGRTPNGIRHKAYTFQMFFKNLKAQERKKRHQFFVQARGRIEGDEPMINDKPAMRKCMTCGVLFKSAGPQNRLCHVHKWGDGT